MSRRFNQKQREALYINAGGKCEMCGRDLPQDWHADHIEPHSKGGATDVINGQALCPECNLTKGSSSMIDSFPYTLRDWQQELYERYFSADKRNFLVVATPGSGKTIAALKIAHQLFRERLINNLIVVCPSDYLRSQWIDEADRAGIPLTDLTINDWRGIVLSDDFAGIVTTYAQVSTNQQALRKYTEGRKTMMVADEVHHCAEELSWGDSFGHAFGPAIKRLMLSGTPFRTDDNKIPFVNYIETDSGLKSQADFAYGYGRALMDHGVVRPIVFPTWDGQLAWLKGFEFKQHTFGDDVTEEEGRQMLRTAIHHDGDWVRDVIKAADNQLDDIRENSAHKDAAGLIVATDTTAAEKLANVLREVTGERAAIATSKVDDAKQVIERFRDGNDKWIVAVRMISEGVDIKRLRVGVYATTTATRVFFYQVVGRTTRWIDGIKQQTAYFYFPMYAPLVRYMKEMTDEIEHVIANHEATWEIDRSASGTIQAQFYQFVDSAATEADTIYLDYAFSEEQLSEAERIYSDIPGVRNLSRAEKALLMFRARGEEPPRREDKVSSPDRHISTHKKREALKKEANRSANMVAGVIVDHGLENDFQTAIRKLHTAWGKRNGYHDEMSMDQLEEKICWLGELYSGIKARQYHEWYAIT